MNAITRLNQEGEGRSIGEMEKEKTRELVGRIRCTRKFLIQPCFIKNFTFNNKPLKILCFARARNRIKTNNFGRNIFLQKVVSGKPCAP